MSELRYIHVVGPEEDAPNLEDFEQRLFASKQEADTYCYFRNNAQTKRGIRQKITKRLTTYTVPITIHWEDLH